MKLALFADIHSNLEAITACLAHAQALGVDRYAFLGDLVGYGADPVAVLDLVQDHAANGAVVVLGNQCGCDRPSRRYPERQRSPPLPGLGLSLASGSARFSAACLLPSGMTISSSCMPVPPRPRSGLTLPAPHRRKKASWQETPVTSFADTCMNRSSTTWVLAGDRCRFGPCPARPSLP